ncbi:MAG TPA: thiamine diphosphokinase [Ilumatobacteraceae bacterium]
MPQSRTAVVVTGGSPVSARALAALPSDALVIAADSGLDHALMVGLRPTVVVGDFDSVSESSLAIARAKRMRIVEHPTDKDSTDTELALAFAVDEGATDVILVSGGGDRLDHSIGALTALGAASLAGLASVSAYWGDALVRVLHPPRAAAITTSAGVTFSLLALHGPCTGVTVGAARWPLDGAELAPGSGLGLSNVALGSSVRVSVRTGVLTVIVPHQFGGST